MRVRDRVRARVCTVCVRARMRACTDLAWVLAVVGDAGSAVDSPTLDHQHRRQRLALPRPGVLRAICTRMTMRACGVHMRAP